jgi:glycosyltransferase involved in cell wall biosynthesis
MKILLLGDMSAYHKNLATGLRSLGYSVDVASSGDSFKNFSRDIEFGPDLTQNQRLDFIKNKINQYDIVQFIKDDVLGIKEMLRLFQMYHTKKIRAKLFLSTVGCDYVFWTKGRARLGIPVFDEIERIDNKGVHNTWRHLIKNKLMRACVQGEIGCYEYYEAYSNSKKCKDPVFQPIDLSELSFNEMDFSGKLVIYHGVQPGREGFKGSHHIIQAFEMLNKKYPNDVKCIAKGGLPLKLTTP